MFNDNKPHERIRAAAGHSKGADIPFDSNGRKIISSHFTDGCPVKLVVESEITINGIKYYNYTTTILLNPKF